MGIKLRAICGGEPREKCGVFAASSPNRQVSLDIFYGMMALQHRGQESAGMAVVNGKGDIRVHVGMGLVPQVFTNKELQYLYGGAGIGHNRYATTGASDLTNAQPFVFKLPEMQVAVGFNGNIVNYEELKAGLEDEGHVFISTTDTEVIGQLFINHVEAGKDYFGAAKALMDKLDGAYSVTMLTGKGEVIAFRDPAGFKPLCIGSRDGTVFIASENGALDAVDAKFEREIAPGEAVVVRDGKTETKRLVEQSRLAQCMFEWIYFLRADAVFGGRLAYRVRENLGRELAKANAHIKGDVVVPVPDSGRSAAQGYACQSGIPLEEGLVKNRYVWRTFIMPSDKARKMGVKLKLNPVREIVGGKRVILVDDSIVRGTTMAKIVGIMREAGAKEVHLMVSCPKIISPCYMGVDFPTYKELVASDKDELEIALFVGADTVTYTSMKNLVDAIGIPKDSLCTACLDEEYPTKVNPTVKLHHN